MTGLSQRPWQVAAFLAGRRTQVRVPIRWPLKSLSDGAKRRIFTEADAEEVRELIANPRRHPCARIRSPLGAPGTVLAIREAYRFEYDHDTGLHYIRHRVDDADAQISRDKATEHYAAIGEALSQVLDGPPWRYVSNWRSPATMPLDFARLRNRVLDIRVHLVREIGEDEAWAEGCESGIDFSEREAPAEYGARDYFAYEWDGMYGPGSFDRDWCFAATVEPAP